MESIKLIVIIIISLICYYSEYLVSGHGMLMKPAGRVSAWRVGFKTPINYNDMEMWCGGLGVKQANQGKCGICGDPWNATRESELPNGKWVTRPPTLTGHYVQDQWFDVTVNLTAAHKGYFIFRLCPAESDENEVSQECLDKYVLEIAGSDDRFKFQVGDRPSGVYNFTLALPSNLTCSRCVLQWDYTAGNQGKRDIDNETFRACADIQITKRGTDDSGAKNETVSTSTTTKKPSTSSTTTTTAASSTTTASSTTNSTITSTTSASTTSQTSKSTSTATTVTTTTTTSTTGASTPQNNNSTTTEVIPDDSGSDQDSSSISPNSHKMKCKGSFGRDSYDEYCQENCDQGYCQKKFCICENV